MSRHMTRRCDTVSAVGEVEAALAGAIREHRRAQEMSQASLARLAGMPVDAVQPLEVGRRSISAAELIALALALGVPLASLLYRLDVDVQRRLGL